MRLILLLSLLLFSKKNIFSQNVEYSIADVTGSKPVVGAEVCFSKGIDTLCFISNKNGKIYPILDKGVYVINITKEGFESYRETIEMDNNSYKTFYLWKNTLELEEIIIETRRNNLNRNFGITTLKVDESPFFQNASFDEIIRIIPEIAINNDKISILGKNRILYLINGRESTRNINQLQANQIDKIEVISNPSAKYQANYDAVINIILKKNKDRGLFLNTNSTTHFNRKNSYHNSIDLGLNLGKLNIESNFKYDFDNGLVYDNGWQDYYDKMEDYHKKYNSKKEYLEISTNINYELDAQNDTGTNFTFGRTPKNSIESKTDSQFYNLNNIQDSLVNSINERMIDVDFFNLNFYHSFNEEKKRLSTYFSLISSDNILNSSINSFNSNANTLNQNILSNNRNHTYILIMNMILKQIN